MKKQILRFLAVLIPAIALLTRGNAQAATSGLALNLKEISFNEAGINPGRHYDRALRDFSKRFMNAGNVNWLDIADGSLAKFITDGVTTKAFYNREGRWYATILTYGQEKLSKDIRKLVKSTYYDYDIYQVAEITISDKIVYLVKIQDNETFKTIRIMDGEMDVYEDYIKG